MSFNFLQKMIFPDEINATSDYNPIEEQLVNNTIKDEEEGPIASNRSIMAALTPKAPTIEDLVKTEEKLQQNASAASTLPIASTKQSKPKEESDLQDIDFGDNSIAKLQALKDALSRSRDAVFANSAARLGAATAAQMSGTKNQFDEAIAGQIEQAKSIPDNYLKQVAFEKEDPNSAMSKGYRDIAKSLGFNVIGSASAADLERIIPQMSNIYNQKQAQQARAEQAELQRELTAKMAASAKAAKKESELEKLGLKTENEQNKFIERAQQRLDKNVQSYSKIKKSSAMIDEALKNPSGITDVTALYSLISALDPESVVREGEIGLAKEAGGLIGRIQVGLSQLTSNPKLINKKTLGEIGKTIKQLESLADNEYNIKRNLYFTQAKARGIKEDRYAEIDPFYKSPSSVPNKQEGSAKFVRMRLPSGTIKQIPVENKEKAMQMGAVEVK